LFAVSAVSYNALLEVCLKSQDMDRGFDVLDRMANDGVEPDDVTRELVARKRSLRSYYRKMFD
jgi:pentatricopeptide repeat protein